MKLYITAAGVYAGTQAEAKKDGKGWTLEEVPTDKQGLIDYLNSFKFDHADPVPTRETDGYELTDTESEAFAPPSTAHVPAGDVRQLNTGVPTSPSIQLDDDFDKLPVCRQLDLAARAMENARTKFAASDMLG